ncbi:MAG: ABA4-like family protein [Gammaproteobacteria bacterium]|nr:ABA4-like family protein [Gammaproteobacteria bacterium]MDH5728107.1 ABA4-like family protein [Gammaproteobacteria bacterium]
MISADSLFQLFNTLVLPAWLLLLLAPKWFITQRLIIPGYVSLIIALAYTLLVIVYLPDAQGDFQSLSNVASLFQHPYALLAGWLHYLAFDLFIGAWMVQDAQKQNISHGWMWLCLPFCFMLGPIGLLLYFVIRSSYNKQFSLAGNN